MNNETELLIILGSKLDEKWQITDALKARLRYAAKIYNNSPNLHILVCGKYSITFDWLGIKPLAHESVEMKKYLTANGVPPHNIYIENKSKDTISNIYYAKQFLKKRKKYQKIYILCPNSQQPRVRIISDKIFGNDYKFSMLQPPNYTSGSATDYENSEIQKLLHKDNFVYKIADGNDSALKYQFFGNSHYQISKSNFLRQNGTNK